MIKIILMVALVVLGLIGFCKSLRTTKSQLDGTHVPAIVFVVSLILAIAGSVGLGMAFASY